MSGHTGPAEGGGGMPPRWPSLWRQIRQQATHLTLIVLVVVGLALGLSAVAAVLQAGRDEARGADLILAAIPAIPSQALVDHLFELHRRGFAPLIVLTGEGSEGLRAQLLERGMREDAVLRGEGDASGAAGLQTMAREAHTMGAQSALVVTAPEAELLGLKVVQDQGLRAYGAPAPGSVDPLSLLWASVQYWQYVLGLAALG